MSFRERGFRSLTDEPTETERKAPDGIPPLDPLELAPPGFDPEAPPALTANLDHLELPAPPVACDLTGLEQGPFAAPAPLFDSRLDALALAPPGFESPCRRAAPMKAA
jgi:hypothetical protein